MIKKLTAVILTVVMMMVLFAGCDGTNMGDVLGGLTGSEADASLPGSDSGAETEFSNVRPQDDFYTYVNKYWMDNVNFTGFTPKINVFSEITTDVYMNVYTLLEINSWFPNLEGDMEKLIKFYKTASDFENRNAQGFAPVEEYIGLVKGISSIDEVQLVATELDVNMLGTFMMFSIAPDKLDSTINRLYLSGPALQLGEKSYYNGDTEHTQRVIDAYITCLEQLFVLAGEDESAAEQMALQAFTFEKILAGSTLSLEESMDDDKTYNVYDLDDFSAQYSNFDVKGFLERVDLVNPEYIIVMEEEYYKTLDEAMIQENLEAIKSFMYAQVLIQSSSYLSEEIIHVVEDFENTLYGTTGYYGQIDLSYIVTENTLGELIGKMYVENYFSDEDKAAVAEIVQNIIAAYEKRIMALDWMSESTKAKAIKKLETLSVKVGYPDVWTDYSGLIIQEYSEGGSVFRNVAHNYQYNYADFTASLDKPVDREGWNMSAHTVNAYYNTSLNEIVFPAGILQAPFYDVNASESANYGGIGSVIAHELSHAFDYNGSKYDENGNQANWWDDGDLTNFNEKTEALVEQFNSCEALAGYNVNGKLTLDENIADLGAIACVVDIVKDLPEGNLEELFTSYATIWRSVSTEQSILNRLIEDSHAPDIFRVNVILSNTDEFYEVYNVQKKDDMYISPEERVRIW